MSNPLAALQEITPPAPVPYTPQTWGWAVLAVLLLLLVGWGAWRLWRHHQAQAWRRAALSELAAIEAALGDEATRLAAQRALPALVKRVGLVIAPREKVAELSGTAWLQWLDGTWRGTAFSTGPGQLLPALAWQARPPAETADLIALLRRWIAHVPA
ncbi:DUF4381 domain-containing protein [Silvimonas amylolytica]|uniref:DUF4381 domain-containing protein n=1 Tax=Silvimonas amylolytica TaxID=449663 RepID=A0ABQ2PJ97_9NEIS|nr:DUF4381 domain-containing protein [Silvimonas amylolytica]GGP25049.1 hypothetical protein GCM10010971_08680 [Silvimonas amylolytica]